MSTQFNVEHMFTYLKGFTTAMNWHDAQNALLFARKAHEGQMRKGGQPYIIHPLTLACHAVALGIRDEVVVASCLYHDVLEDCGYTIDQLPIENAKIKDVVRRLTHVKPTPLTVYYKEIAECPEAIIVKLLDRCDNVSTMAGVFSTAKTLSYIQETYEYVMPLYRKAKTEWPQYSNALFVLKYHITSVVDGLHACLQGYEDDVDKTPLGAEIMRLVSERKTNLQQLCKDGAINYEKLVYMLKGHAKPSKDTLKNLANVLNVDIETLKTLAEQHPC